MASLQDDIVYYIDPSILRQCELYHNSINEGNTQQIESMAFIYGEKIDKKYYSIGVIFPNQIATISTVEEFGELKLIAKKHLNNTFHISIQ